MHQIIKYSEWIPYALCPSVSGEPWIILVENGNEFFLLYGVVKSFVIQLVLSSFFYKKIKI